LPAELYHIYPLFIALSTPSGESFPCQVTYSELCM